MPHSKPLMNPSNLLNKQQLVIWHVVQRNTIFWTVYSRLQSCLSWPFGASIYILGGGSAWAAPGYPAIPHLGICTLVIMLQCFSSRLCSPPHCLLVHLLCFWSREWEEEKEGKKVERYGHPHQPAAWLTAGQPNPMLPWCLKEQGHQNGRLCIKMATSCSAWIPPWATIPCPVPSLPPPTKRLIADWCWYLSPVPPELVFPGAKAHYQLMPLYRLAGTYFTALARHLVMVVQEDCWMIRPTGLGPQLISWMACPFPNCSDHIYMGARP